jgi:hypothetical protein
MKAVKVNTNKGDIRNAEKVLKTYFRPFIENFKPPHAQREERACKYYCISWE